VHACVCVCVYACTCASSVTMLWCRFVWPVRLLLLLLQWLVDVPLAYITRVVPEISYNKRSTVAEIDDSLATTDMAEKCGGSAPF